MSALNDVRIIEFAGIGPGAMAATVLSDMGAKVLRIDRKVPAQLGAPKGAPRYNFLRRNRTDIALDLKSPADIGRVRELLASATVVIEGFRPGVMEKLGLGPDDCLALNPALVYARVTGWGQDGPLAQQPGHDINYIARTGVLDALGRRGQPPTVPVTLVGDMAGGGMFTVAGVLAAILEARRTGTGQVVDVSIVDAVANLALSIFGRSASGTWSPERGTNHLDSGAPFYDVYECADGRYVAVGAIERKFLDNLMRALGLAFSAELDHFDRAHWPALRSALEQAFRRQSRDAWCAQLESRDCCVSPVLDLHEAQRDEHLKARRTFTDVDGVLQPAPALRFSKTPCRAPQTPAVATADAAATERQITAWLA